VGEELRMNFQPDHRLIDRQRFFERAGNRGAHGHQVLSPAVTQDKQKLKTFPGLKAADFQHPWDQAATEALNAIPGFELLCRKVMEYGFERAYYLANTADNVRVTKRMYPRLNRHLEWAAKVLDLEVPELYVTLDPRPNAYTYGKTRPFVVITSGLLDALDDRERFCVIAHELGHVKCNHSLYTMIAQNVSIIIDFVGQMTLGLGKLLGVGLELALFDWMRKSELSADRAGMLGVQDRDVAMKVFMKLAGGHKGYAAQMDHHAFMEQIRAYEDADESKLNKIYKVLLTAFRTHPFPVMRAKHLDDWIESGEYEALSGIKPEPAFAKELKG
jgi:Zn-dependent protease with chaperone function